MSFKSGFVLITGKPNVGKSSLVNSLLGTKVSIVSKKPQTTRNKVLGIINEEGYQIVLIDTPGFVAGKSKLADGMRKEIKDAGDSNDATVFVVDAAKGVSDEEWNMLRKHASRKHTKLIIAVNKVDLINYERLFPLLAKFNQLQGIYAVVPISALKHKNTDELLKQIKATLPEGPAYYDQEEYTDKSERFMVAEIIREKCLILLNQEVPHGVYVEIFKFKQEGKILQIEADIIVERQPHKLILIGDKGSKIKDIGTRARQDIERLMGGVKVNLQLYVKVKKGWRDNQSTVKEILGK
ncbi:MAG: GTPase Era [Firmicutes bacterium]|nr:GTPase Era [Bacillota bacterium]